MHLFEPGVADAFKHNVIHCKDRSDLSRRSVPLLFACH